MENEVSGTLDENAFLGHAKTDVVGRALSAIWPHLSVGELASVLDKVDQVTAGLPSRPLPSSYRSSPSCFLLSSATCHFAVTGRLGLGHLR